MGFTKVCFLPYQFDLITVKRDARTGPTRKGVVRRITRGTTGLAFGRPVASNIERLLSGNRIVGKVTSGADRCSLKPTVKVESLVSRKFCACSAAQAGSRDRQLPGRPATRSVLPCTDRWTSKICPSSKSIAPSSKGLSNPRVQNSRGKPLIQRVLITTPHTP